MIAELTIAGVGIACTIPSLVAEYSDEFEASEWATWVKLLPQLFLIAAGVLCVLRKFMFSLSFSATTLALLYCCLLFNTSSNSAAVCAEYDAACLDQNMTACTGSALEAWQGLLYLLGLSLMTIGSTLLVKESVTRPTAVKTVPSKVPQQSPSMKSPQRSPTKKRPR